MLSEREELARNQLDTDLNLFLESGIYRFPSQNAIFMDPVRVLNDSYSRFRLSSSAYYSRFFDPPPNEENGDAARVSSGRKKKRRRLNRDLNAREISAEKRHQDARPFLLRAHKELLKASDLLPFLWKLKRDECGSIEKKDLSCMGEYPELSFVDLGGIWQAPLFEMSLFSCMNDCFNDKGTLIQHGDATVVQAFDNLIVNDTSDDMVAEFIGHKYIIPMKSFFQMSDLGRIHDLIPAQSDYGFSLIVIDPPWENASAHQKSMYPTLPNRYFLSLPVKQLTHTGGALVALWVTNREKLRAFAEKELLPAWGIVNVTQLYWLKVKADGSLISDLDLFHHRPYECVLLGYSHGKETDSKERQVHKALPCNQVLISIPGDHSRKPPLGKLLLDYIPGPKPARCIELFARELTAGWTSWGNETLHFQDSRYFIDKLTKKVIE